jgi:hypothetical protein
MKVYSHCSKKSFRNISNNNANHKNQISYELSRYDYSNNKKDNALNARKNTNNNNKAIYFDFESGTL